MFKSILLPTDGSLPSEETARRAVSFAKEAGARITAFYVKRGYPLPYASEGLFFDSFDSDSPERFSVLAE